MVPRALVLLLTSTAVAAVVLKPRRAPRGWNSYDSTGSASEAQLRAAIAALAGGALGNTATGGFEYVTTDGFWFDDASAANSESLDAYGRPCPGAARYPSLNCSFKPLVAAARAAGLKLGVWQLFGVPKGAVSRRLPILGTNYTAADVALPQDSPGAAGCGPLATPRARAV